MEEWAEKLLAVQKLDLQCAELTAKLTALPVRAKEIQSSYALEVQSYKAVEASVNAAVSKSKALEAAGAKLVADKQDFQKKTALIKKNDEYRDAMARLEQYDVDIHANEEAQIVAIDEAEAAQKTLPPAKAKLEQAKAEGNRQLAVLREQDTAMRDELAKAQGERKTAAAAVEPALLAQYEQLRGSRTANPMVPWFVTVDNDACGRCHRQLPPQKCLDVRKGARLTCDNCGAILYGE